MFSKETMCVRIWILMCFLDLDKNAISKYITLCDVRRILTQHIFKQIKREIRFLEVVTKYFDSFSMYYFDLFL